MTDSTSGIMNLIVFVRTTPSGACQVLAVLAGMLSGRWNMRWTAGGAFPCEHPIVSDKPCSPFSRG